MKKLKFLSVFLVIGILFSCSKNDASLGYYDEGGISTSGDQYNEIEENPFIDVADEAISTFSIDADGASYSNVRRYLDQDNALAPKDAIRTEEFINYFNLDYPYTNNGHPIDLNGEVSSCPWNTANKLVRIGIKGEPLAGGILPPTNFVFLVDVSGSMQSDDKLNLLVDGFKQFTDELNVSDRIAIVTYAGNPRVVLESTSGDEKSKIKNALNKLKSGGGTNGEGGIIKAYEIAESNFIEGGNNRIIIGTDGDFNVGVSNQDELITLIEEKRESGVYLTVLGVGRGNLQDGTLEQIANKGNGTYEYIDNVNQLLKVFIYENSKFFTVAKDVKVQVEFNSQNVEAYRLIGYENRLLETEDFEDDTKDAGEIGANQSITALYEIVPISNPNFREVPTFNIDFRYKAPNEGISIPMSLDIFDEGNNFDEASGFMKFTASLASFGMLLRDSPYKGESSYQKAFNWASLANLDDPYGFKAEYMTLIMKASSLDQ